MEENHCNICSKVYKQKYNLLRHIKASHQDVKEHKCDLCSKRFSRKQHRDLHYKHCSIKGGEIRKQFTQTIDNLYLTPIKRITAFGGIIAEWTINFPENCESVDPKLLLEKATKVMKPTIQEHLRTQTSHLKFVMSIFVIFQQGHDPDIKTDPPACLISSPYKTSRSSILCANLDHSLHVAAEELFERIEEYEGFGSGWVIDRLTRLDTSINSF